MSEVKTDFFEDYELKPVPPEKRRGWFSIAMVYTGVAISLSALVLGGSLASGLTLSQAVLATLMGSLVLCIFTALCSVVAIKTNLSTAMISKFTFGKKGAIVIIIGYAFSAWGWFGVQTGLFGDTFASILTMAFGINVSEFGTKIIIAIGGLLMMWTAIIGYKAIEKLSIIAVPVMGGLMIFTLIRVLNGDGIDSFSSLQPLGAPISLGVGISMVAGSFMAGAVGSPDIVRYGKSLRGTILAAVIGFMVGFSATIIIATIAAYATGEANIVTIMVTLGWGVLAMLVLILAQWTSNDNNLYSASLGFSVLFETVSKAKLTAVSGVIGTILAVIGIYDFIVPFFLILSAIIPPVAGVYVADFFMNKSKFDFSNHDQIRDFYKLPLISWGTGVFVGFCTNVPPAGFDLFQLSTVSAIDSFLVALLVHIIITKLTNKTEDQAAITTNQAVPTNKKMK